MFGSLLHLKSGAIGPLGLVESLFSWWLPLLSECYNLHAAVYILNQFSFSLNLTEARKEGMLNPIFLFPGRPLTSPNPQ